MFRFRLGFMIGVAIGFVIGARAGRGAYDMISDAARKLAGSEPAQELGMHAREVADRAGSKLEEKAAEGVSKVADTVRNSTRSTSA